MVDLSALLKKRSKNFDMNSYVSEVEKLFHKGIATEHSYRHLIISMINHVDDSITIINEPKRIECGAPDFILLKKNIPIGYIEAKDIGVDLDSIVDTDQFKRYTSGLKNVIFTNHYDFIWYVNGQEKLRFSIGKYKRSNLSFDEALFLSSEAHLKSFLSLKTENITSASDLAKRLATLAQSINGLILASLDLEEEDGWLNKWFNGFKQTLVPGLTEADFSDMFSQTLAYGLFAARVHMDEGADFSRYSASSILPKTNPFLRKLFAQFAGESMPETISWAVDEIVEVLKHTDIDSIKGYFGKSNDKEDAVIHFYENFLGEYNPALKQKRGVYYTPDSLVGFITRSVDEILIKDFKKPNGLADDQTLILDPALGTASFLFSAIEKIHEKNKDKVDWNIYVKDNLLERLFGFEILMAPYSVAHLKIGMQLQRMGYKFTKDQRLGVYLTNTLEETAKRSNEFIFDFIAHEANSAFDVKRDRPIVVVMGNPPYSGQSENNGEWITNLMKGYDTISKKKTHSYFECDGKSLNERNTKWLNDDYVKFIRFAQWRIEQTGHGVIGFVTNHGFIDNPTFRGMRESLMKSFDDIYILDLHGNSKKKETCPNGDKDENVFDIQQGVSISFFVKKKYEKAENHLANVYRADLWGTRESKYDFLKEMSWDKVKWKLANPTSPNYYYLCQDEDEKKVYSNYWPIDKVFKVSSVGVLTGRDHLNIHFNEKELLQTMKKFSSMKPAEARDHFELGNDSRDWRVEFAQKDILGSKLNKKFVVPITYRPFDTRFTFYTGKSRGLYVNPRYEVMKNVVGQDNLCLITARTNKSSSQNHFYLSKYISEAKTGESTTQSYCFPLFLKGDQDNLFGKQDNLDDDFKKLLSLKNSEHCIYYIYAILYSSQYREKFKDFFKLDFPRVPIFKNLSLREKLANIGEKLSKLHLLDFESKKNNFKGEDAEIVKVLLDISSGRLYINKSSYFADVKKEVWDYEIGGHKVLDKWLKARTGRVLLYDELVEFSKILHAIHKTLDVCSEIDTLLEAQKIEAYDIFPYLPAKELLLPKSNNDVLNIKNDSFFKNKSELDMEARKRLVLGSHIIDSLKKGESLGSVKLQKILYLLDTHVELKLKTNYEREVAGPLDYNLMYSKEVGIQGLGEKYLSFKVKKRKSAEESDVYEPLENLSQISRDLDSIFKEKSKQIKELILLMSGMKTYQSEIVATLYACWNDFIISKRKFTDGDIVKDYLENWHPKKKKYPKKQLLDALKWMKQKGLVPKGLGKPTKIKKIKKTEKDDYPF